MFLKKSSPQSVDQIKKMLYNFYTNEKKMNLACEINAKSRKKSDCIKGINRFLNKDLGKDILMTYKRVSNILDQEKKKNNIEISGEPDSILFNKEEEKSLFEKINEIRKAFSVREEDKNYEKLLIQLSEIKSYTDSFFDNVVVNDENNDIKNNRLELLKMFCKTFNNFIDFSKLEGA